MVTLSTAGKYFEPCLSAALHKLLMRPSQTDVGLPTFDLESIRVKVGGPGERNSSLTPSGAPAGAAAPDGGETS